MSAEQALEIFFLCLSFFLRYVLLVARLVNYKYIYRYGEREKHQLSVTIIFHLCEQMTGCQKDEIFYSCHFLLRITCMSVFCENFMHVCYYFFLTAIL